MINASRCTFAGGLKAASAVTGIALLAVASMPSQAAYVAESKSTVESAATAVRDRLAASGDAGSFVAISGAQTEPDANAVVPTIAAPVPEPETAALMLAGLGVVGWAARRRRSA